MAVQWLIQLLAAPGLSHRTPLPRRPELLSIPVEAPLVCRFCSPPTHTPHCSQTHLPHTRSSYATCYLTPGADAHLLRRSTSDVPAGVRVLVTGLWPQASTALLLYATTSAPSHSQRPSSITRSEVSPAQSGVQALTPAALPAATILVPWATPCCHTMARCARVIGGIASWLM